MSSTTLLAKSNFSSLAVHPWATLDGHTIRAVETGAVLVDEWGNEFLSALGLPPDWLADLRQALLIALLGHDLGKPITSFSSWSEER